MKKILVLAGVTLLLGAYQGKQDDIKRAGLKQEEQNLAGQAQEGFLTSPDPKADVKEMQQEGTLEGKAKHGVL